MQIYVTPQGEDIFELDWPDQLRIPESGELILTPNGTFQVFAVQWELVDPDAWHPEDKGMAPTVQLRVSRRD